jgi:hypothetical protein
VVSGLSRCFISYQGSECAAEGPCAVKLRSYRSMLGLMTQLDEKHIPAKGFRIRIVEVGVVL